MRTKYYEDTYAVALAAGVDRYNNPLEGNFGDLFIRSLLPPNGRVLDLGCGEGLYSLLFAAEVRASAPSRISEMKFIHGDNVIYARRKCSQHAAQYALEAAVPLALSNIGDFVSGSSR
jgi:methylase of polypeptide subunit release factors